jgi:hypothetical protein
MALEPVLPFVQMSLEQTSLRQRWNKCHLDKCQLDKYPWYQDYVTTIAY